MRDVSTLREVTEEKYFQGIGNCTKKYYVDELNRKQGQCKIYSKNGWIYKTSFYVDNKKHGYVEKYRQETEILYHRVCYYNGELKYRELYDNGYIYEYIEYKEKKRNGKYSLHYNNGKLHSRGTYKKGEFDGAFEYFYNNDDNTVKKIIYYDNGKETNFV